jgi:hypothetical protein
MVAILKIEPLMLNNKLAVERINKLMDSVAGDIQEPIGSYDIKVTDGVVLMDCGNVNVHTAVGYEDKRVIVKSTLGGVYIQPKPGETIDKKDFIYLSKHDSLEIISDNSNWWII